MKGTDLKYLSEGKTSFTDWYDNFRSTACQKIKKYSDLNIHAGAVDEGSDGIFYLNEMHRWKRRATVIAVQDKNQGLNQRAIAQTSNTDEHQQTPMNTETLMTDLWRKERRLTDADRRAERRCVSLVRSG